MSPFIKDIRAIVKGGDIYVNVNDLKQVMVKAALNSSCLTTYGFVKAFTQALVEGKLDEGENQS